MNSVLPVNPPDTAPPTTPTTPQTDTKQGETVEKVDKAGTQTSAPDTAPHTTPPSTTPPQGTTVTLVLPPGVERTPIAEIDYWIREGYVSQRQLEDIMKGNHQGKAYRTQVEQRLALYKARQPPFDNVPVSRPVVVSGAVQGGAIQGAVQGAASGATPVLPTILAHAPHTITRVPASNSPDTAPDTGIDAIIAALIG